jgi:hypothetical protein
LKQGGGSMRPGPTGATSKPAGPESLAAWPMMAGKIVSSR